MKYIGLNLMIYYRRKKYIFGSVKVEYLSRSLIFPVSVTDESVCAHIDPACSGP